MKSYTKYLWFETKKLREIVPITDQVDECVEESKVKEGFCLVSAMHITASVFVNDEESGIWEDFSKWLEQLAPSTIDWKHNHTGDPNADAHLKRTIMGHQVILPITNGKLDLGPWEKVHYGEFDGKRKKRVIIKIIGE
ncbi:MAG TPA: secondary thiamine-phosphate synthase enzyme YjbQ [Candidatus Norongarragalinales archaeon]|nr:secondary thiamine-phosphate synthase enzyme YjbQ [Candidatus Norongarragalinales archaeon]